VQKKKKTGILSLSQGHCKNIARARINYHQNAVTMGCNKEISFVIVDGQKYRFFPVLI
jgi:hypothetical protein